MTGDFRRHQPVAWPYDTDCPATHTSIQRDAIRALSWRGPCELEVMRARDNGRYYLLEINPRFPAWVFLAVGAGRNLPWATVELALGRQVDKMPPPEAGVMFLRHSFDQICRLSDYEALTTAGELMHARGER